MLGSTAAIRTQWEASFFSGYSVTDQPPRKNRHLWAILIVILEKKCSWTRCPLRFLLKNNDQPPLKAAGFRIFKVGGDLPLFFLKKQSL